MSELKSSIKSLDPADKPVAGQGGRPRPPPASTSWSRRAAPSSRPPRRPQAGERDRLDLTLGGHGRRRGHLHLVTQVQRELEDIFVGMGYRVVQGPEVEDDWHNFEALNIPPGHPARSMQDTLYVELGEPEQVMLRTHTSPVQIRTMETQAPPIYVVAPGRTYRNETLDARHSPVFHQIEALAVDRGITLADLFGTIETFVRRLFGDDRIRTRFRPDFFPYTEPSAELAVSCIFCDGAGCRVCSQSGWIELGGCGMVDPNVLQRRGHRPRGVHRVRVRLRPRPHRDDPLRHRRDQDVLRRRRALPGAVLRHPPCAHRSPGSVSSRPVDAPVADIVAALNQLGLEVEGVEQPGDEITGVDRRAGPRRRCRTRTPTSCRSPTSTSATARPRVVCGAPNIVAGMVVPFAPSGATLPGGFTLERRKIRGEVSDGMLLLGQGARPRRRPRRHPRARRRAPSSAPTCARCSASTT